MIIKSISIRNFKSYGNNLQKLTFPEDGSLILLSGKNGNGKSSLIESIDFSLYNIVRGKNTKRIPNYILPNRTNKNLETEINFINWKNDNIVINRKLNPKNFNITINGIDQTRKYELADKKEIDDIIGLEYNTYKSLVSLNLADFSNFINLESDKKRNLLNKTFNINEIDDYHSISKEMLKILFKEKENNEFNILNLQNTINLYKENINNIISNTEINNQIEIKKLLSEYKNEFFHLKDEIDEFKNSISNIETDIKNKYEILNKKKIKIQQDNLQYNNINEKIQIFNNGQCPYCGSLLKDDNHDKEHKKLIEDLNNYKIDIITLKENYNQIKLDTQILINEKNKLNNELSFKENRYSFILNEIKNLKLKYNKKDEISINEIEKNISKINEDIEKFQRDSIRINDQISKLNKIIDYLSESGIRTNLIRNIVEPINEHLSKYLIDFNSNFNVRLDDNFDAIIKERYIDDIHLESLSTGEARKINLAIAMSYIETIIDMNKKTNILFLDEVFASVDIESIDIILKVLKNFSMKNKINIIIVNHTPFENTKFDKIINIEKKLGYSFIFET